MRTLTSSQLLAVAHELADPSYDRPMVIVSPSRESRATTLHDLICTAIRPADRVCNPDQLRAIDALQDYLQDADHPSKLYNLLEAVMLHLFPESFTKDAFVAGFHQLPRDLQLPTGMNQHDICDLCCHGCYLNLREWYPGWLRPNPDEIRGPPTATGLLPLDSDHPLAILLHYALHLQTDHTKQQFPLLQKRWMRRAASLPADHRVWELDGPEVCWEDGCTDDIYVYVPVYGPASGQSLLHLGWTVSPREAQMYVESLLWASKGIWRPPEVLVQRKSVLQELQPGKPVAPSPALSWKGGSHSSPFPGSQGRAQLADGTEAADTIMLQREPARYIKRLLNQCELRVESLPELMEAFAEAQAEAQADDPSVAQDPAQTSCNIIEREGLSRADAVALALLQEEETAKARAQARKDAQLRKRSSKASTKVRPGKGPVRGPQETVAAQLQGRASSSKAQPDPDDAMLPVMAAIQQQQQPDS